MAQPLELALQITLIGMTLVFGTIVLLWLILSILMRLTIDRVAAEPDRSPDNQDLKQRVAIAAVAVALAQHHDRSPKEFPLPPTAIVSAWQAVTRSRQLTQRGPVRRRSRN